MLEPPAEVLAWVESRLDARVTAAVAMSGGIDAHMFRVSLLGRDDVVVRISRGGDWDDVTQQAKVLTALGGTGVPAPLPLAVDPEVGKGRHQVLVQTLLPGDVTLPRQPSDAWISSLVATMRQLQAVPLADWMPGRDAVRWAQIQPTAADDWSPEEQVLVDALRRQQDSVPLTPVFVHDDFWPGNTLRDGDRIVGIVDWAQAGAGSAARDATYCAVDVSLCYGVEVGDALLAAFRSGVDVPDDEMHAWTARAVLMSRHYRSWMTGWTSLGVPVTPDAVSARRTMLLDRALTRLG